MLTCFNSNTTSRRIPISVVTVAAYPQWLATQNEFVKSWLSETKFQVEAGSVRILPETSGKIDRVICCVKELSTLWGVGGLPFALPEGIYEFDQVADQYEAFAIAWGLGAYQFTRYKKPTRTPAQLYLPDAIKSKVNNIVESTYLVRDCINTPTDDMGPSELSVVVENLADQYEATFSQLIAEELIDHRFPCIYTVGRASDDPARLLDLRWGNPAHPKVTLVGKGVCFDTGGLDLKPSSYMLLMKKDMGGAAHVLGLARMIMEAKLPVFLRVLIPAVENAVSGNAYRPGDVITSRKGLTIEIGNTDAEGRVILCDALTEAVSEKPDLLIDISTLTGAARVALGTELPALFCNNDQLAQSVLQHGERECDPMWRLPLFAPYREHLNSQIADINNNSSESTAGAISAALFLKEFVPDEIPWIHLDLMAWNTKAKPGRPQGGEAMSLRGLFSYLQTRFAGN